MKIFKFLRKDNTPLVKETLAPKIEKPEGQYGVSTGGETGEVTPETYNLTSSEILNLYLSNSWLRKYIEAVVLGCLRYPLRAISTLGEANTKTDKRIEEVNYLLRYPNTTEPFSSVREKYLKDLLLYGNGAIEISPDKGVIKGLYAAPGYLLKINADVNGNLDEKKAYFFVDPDTGTAIDKLYPFDAIIHFKYDQLSDRLYGMSPIQSANREFTADSNSVRDLQTGTQEIPPAIISFPKTSRRYVDEVIHKLQLMLNDKRGVKIAGINVEGKKIELSNKTPKDELELQQWLSQRHNVFLIPPFKLGYVDQVGSMSAREQREEFAGLLSTLISYECEMLTLVLVKTRLGFEDIEITAPGVFTRLEFERTRIVERLVNAGIITPNEARTQFLGLSRRNEEVADILRQPKAQGNA